MVKARGYSFKKTTNLFNETVIMVLRNKDKKHLASLGDEHVKEMLNNGLNPDNGKDIINYLVKFNYVSL
jgi:hypothetical protein